MRAWIPQERQLTQMKAFVHLTISGTTVLDKPVFWTFGAFSKQHVIQTAETSKVVCGDVNF